jgi:hypothetical protein
MRMLRVLVCTLLFFGSPLNSQSRPQTPSATQPAQLIQQALAALTGGQSVTDVTLTASAHRIAGSDDETGTATLKAVASGASSLSLILPSGPRTEILNSAATPPTGSWSGPDAVVHPIAFHNLLTGPSWFFPAFSLATSSFASGATLTYLGHEAHSGRAVEHVSVSQVPPAQVAAGAVPFLRHLTQVDFFLDSTSLLPVAISFTTHPDTNAVVDIPVEIAFSDYRAVNGTQVPFHIQKYLNNSLALDFQASSVTLNTGLTASTFNVQ